jgi:DNA modification methylase
MKIKTVAIGSISQDPANLRKHGERNIDAIVASLRKFGQQHPIVIDSKGIILSGNGRYMAAVKLGWSDIKVVESSLTGSAATAYAIADNRTAELAEWDTTALAETLRALQSEEFDTTAAGYSDGEIDALVEGLGSELLGADKEIIEDEIPEPPVDPITKAGDLWILGEHRVLCGDSTKAADVARLMAGAKADLCFTSPPYNIGSLGWAGSSKYTADKDEKQSCDYLEFLTSSTRLILSYSTASIINIQQVSGNKIAFIEWLYEWRKHIVDIAIWDKGNAEPAMEPGVLGSAFEYLVVLSSKLNPTRKLPLTSWRGTIQNIHRGGKRSGNQDSNIHRATFPMHLPEYGFLMFDVADTIYDPFLGSGTTLIAAQQLNRKCYGMEISPQYCDVIVKRWENLTGMVAVRETSVKTPA